MRRSAETVTPRPSLHDHQPTTTTPRPATKDQQPGSAPRAPARMAQSPGTDGGEGGIRTHGARKDTHAFQACTFGRSVTSPPVFRVVRSPALAFLRAARRAREEVWRRGWDSNPRCPMDTLVFETSPFGRSGTSPGGDSSRRGTRVDRRPRASRAGSTAAGRAFRTKQHSGDQGALRVRFNPESAIGSGFPWGQDSGGAAPDTPPPRGPRRFSRKNVTSSSRAASASSPSNHWARWFVPG
jgi:hypothetical protein